MLYQKIHCSFTEIIKILHIYPEHICCFTILKIFDVLSNVQRITTFYKIKNILL